MAKLLGALAFILFVAVSSARQPDEYHDFKQLMKLLSKPRVLDRQVYTNQVGVFTVLLYFFDFYDSWHSWFYYDMVTPCSWPRIQTRLA